MSSVPVAIARQEQTFPVLPASDISRIRRFATPVAFRSGDRLFVAGEASPGMFVVLKGFLTATMRDGMGHTAPIARHGPGKFSGQVAQLSGGPALVDGIAGEDGEALLLAPEQLRRHAAPELPGPEGLPQPRDGHRARRRCRGAAPPV